MSNLPDDTKHLMSSEEISALIQSMALAIREQNEETIRKHDLLLVGIQRGGVPLAQRLAAMIFGATFPVATLDISMYRDDIGIRKTLPKIYETRIPFDINGKTLVLVDDVLQSGRSIRAALDAITDYGRPSIVRLAVLIDRGLREYPIYGDYVGKYLKLPPDRKVSIHWKETCGGDADYAYSILKTNS